MLCSVLQVSLRHHVTASWEPGNKSKRDVKNWEKTICCTSKTKRTRVEKCLKTESVTSTLFGLTSFTCDCSLILKCWTCFPEEPVDCFCCSCHFQFVLSDYHKGFIHFQYLWPSCVRPSSRGTRGEEHLSLGAWDVCCRISEGLRLRSRSVTLVVKILRRNRLLTSRLWFPQVTWWVGPWRTWTSCWLCRMAAGSRTWSSSLPTSSSSTT